MDLIRIFNRTVNFAYFPNEKYMDFATFSTLGNLFKLFVRNDQQTMGYLHYSDLISVGQYTSTYKLVQNYTQLIVKNHLIYENLSKGTKMNNLIFYNGDKTIRNFRLIKDNSKKISIEQLFLIYRHFDTLSSNNFTFPFTFTVDKFSFILQDPLFTQLKLFIDSSYDSFQKASSSAGQNFSTEDYLKFIFNIIDLNNSTFIEVYEILLVQKACSIFKSLEKNGEILNNSNDTSLINNLKSNFIDNNILIPDKSEEDYMIYVNLLYKTT